MEIIHLHFLMSDKLLDADKDMSRTIGASVDRFAALVFAPGDVELELSVVKLLVVSVERAGKHSSLRGLIFVHRSVFFQFKL